MTQDDHPMHRAYATMTGVRLQRQAPVKSERTWL
jgi:hypothetical protein